MILEILANIVFAVSDAAARHKRMRRRRQMAEAGYRLVELPSGGMGNLFGETEDWFVPSTLVDKCLEFRSNALRGCLARIEAAVTVSNHASLCAAAQKAYDALGDLFEARLVAEGSSPETAQFVRSTFYDYRFARQSQPSARIHGVPFDVKV